MTKILLLLSVAILNSCASASKDIYFRTRLPTMETIEMGEDGSFGFGADLESKRFTIKTTRNLVDDFTFYTDNADLQNGKSDADVTGLDLQGTYKNTIQNFLPFRIAVSFDHAELKLGLFDARDGGKGWKGIINGGYYKTAAYQTNGTDCSFFDCFFKLDTKAASAIEDDLNIDYKGSETKAGTSIGYYFNHKHALYIGYNQLNGKVEANAHKESTDTRIALNEAVKGLGYGLGYAFRANVTYTGSFSVEHIEMSWGEAKHQATILAFQNHFAF
jgi:hypothetical protein